MGLDGWCTPREVAEPLEDFFDGPVDFDPCSNERSIIKARAANTRPVGLLIPWFGKVAPRVLGRTTYENPPYSKLLAFTDKSIKELDRRDIDVPVRERQLVRLVTCAPSTAWWRRAVGREPVTVGSVATMQISIKAPKPTLIITNRLEFINEMGEIEESARFDSALFYYGPREEKFLRTFAPITSWSVRRSGV